MKEESVEAKGSDRNRVKGAVNEPSPNIWQASNKVNRSSTLREKETSSIKGA